MDKDLLEKLYDIFASTNKTNMFSIFSFNRRMNGKKTMDALSNLENFLNNVARKFHSSQASSEEELATIYLRLCETFSEKDLQQLLSSVIPESRGYFLTPDESAKAQEVEESNKKIEKQIEIFENKFELNFNEDYIDGLVYKPKGCENREDVFAPIKRLIPSKNNAFLFNIS